MDYDNITKPSVIVNLLNIFYFQYKPRDNRKVYDTS